jgi:hypothetical protein
MALTIEEVKALAKEREYSSWSHSANYSWMHFISNDHYRIGLQVWPETGDFELSRMFGLIHVSTGKCGSFENQDHFAKFEAQMVSIISTINRYGAFE